MDKKALIFDLDGTLVDTLSDIASAVNSMLSHYGFPLHQEDEIRKMIGKGAKNLISQALPSDEIGMLDEALAYYRQCYDSNLVVKTHAYDGVLDVLHNFKEKGVKLAILSNKDDCHVKRITDALMPDLFVSANGFSPMFPHKPAPDSLFAIMDQMKVSSAETAYVGDSAVDVQTARNANVMAIGVTWGFGGEASFAMDAPDVLIRDPHEFFKL